MKAKNSDLTAFLILTLAVVLWGGNWVAVRYAVQEVSPLVVVTVRTILSLFILLIALKVGRYKKPGLRQIKQFAFLGFIGIFGFNFLQYMGLRYTTAINGSLINAATPIMTVILSSLLIKEKMGPVQIAGIFISFLGVGWVITKGSWQVIANFSFNTGDLMVLIAALCWSVYSILGKKPTLQFSSVAVTAYSSLFAAIYFTPLGIIQYAAKPVQSISWPTIIAVGYTVFVGVFALVAWIKGVSMIGAGRASVFMNLMPLFTLMFASIFLQETITSNQRIGAIFVLGGVFLATSPRFVWKPVTG